MNSELSCAHRFVLESEMDGFQSRLMRLSVRIAASSRVDRSIDERTLIVAITLSVARKDPETLDIFVIVHDDNSRFIYRS